MEINKRFKWKVSPKANGKSMLIGNNYRFTALTDRLIRLEYSAEGKFEDRATQVVFHRDFPECKFSANLSDGILTAETDEIIITYKENAEFTGDTLKIKLKNEPASEWKFGEEFETLGGTYRTLDMTHGRTPTDNGVVSRNGFSVIDDSESLCLGEDGWIETRKEEKDIYFFGYGFDYKQAVKDFYKLTGAPPMLPAYALGNWWSRFYKYTQDSYIALMDKFAEEDVPFSVGVIDMDWHIVKVPDEYKEADWRFTYGWTGYSWNKEFFPDYKKFLKELKDRNIKTSLNLHPAAGVAAHEDMYEEMAKACGIDPATKKRVPFNVLSKEFMKNYFDILHHPYENDGIDFWWMDWQQGTDYWWMHEANRDGNLQDPLEKADPLWMLNHYHIIDIMRDGKRPMFFSRYSGPGSHRYPVGFSGDTYVCWDSLDFQPEFTATASNVGYSFWSHDIGGHTSGYMNGEIYTRWLQFGVFSPINRLHSSGDQYLAKEPWGHGKEYEGVLKKWLRLRHQLFPYIYTMVYKNHKDGEPLIRPLYYDYPKCDNAYKYKNQYMFGSELLICPITEPSDSIVNLGKATGWLPKGDWFDFFNGTRYVSRKGRIMDFYRKLEDYPVFAKAGAIVPMQPHRARDNKLCPKPEMDIYIFPGANGEFTLYEDEGEYETFEKGAFATTRMSLSWGDIATFKIESAKGDTSLIPKIRAYRIYLRGFNKDIKVSAFVGGKEVPCESSYNAETLTVSLSIVAKTSEEIELKIEGENLVTDNGDLQERVYKIVRGAKVSMSRKGFINQAMHMDNYNHRYKTCRINFESFEERNFEGAIREQLMLLADEFED
ncbi:MAG: DUF5110 domain-containing protein [Clostridia bacterium]|nr:DUF5110 domain-containing protein [Clostridia bacterium]